MGLVEDTGFSLTSTSHSELKKRLGRPGDTGQHQLLDWILDSASILIDRAYSLRLNSFSLP